MSNTTTRIKIPNLSDLGIALLDAAGVDYEHYAYEVTQEDFDEYDQDGPGSYSGVIIGDRVAAARWDEAVGACRAAGLQGGSREGLLLRLGILLGSPVETLPPALEKVLAARMDAAVAETARVAAIHAAIAKVRDEAASLVAGGTAIHSGHPNQSTYWVLDRRKELPSLLKNPFYQDAGDLRLPGTGLGWSEIFRLPDGDLFVVSPTSSCVVTFNAALAAERQARKAIAAHDYDLGLWEAIYDAEIKGWMNVGICSWLGGGFGHKRDVPRRPAHSGDNNPYGPEVVARLREFCDELLSKSWITRKPEAVAAVTRVKELAVDGSVRHVLAS